MSDLTDKMKCIDELMQNIRLLENEVATLKAELNSFNTALNQLEKNPNYKKYCAVKIATLEAEIKELKEGIPIEKAKRNGTVYNYYVADEKHWEHVTWADSIGWHYWDYYSDCTVIVHPERLYPLSSQNSQTQEGS